MSSLSGPVKFWVASEDASYQSQRYGSLKPHFFSNLGG